MKTKQIASDALKNLVTTIEQYLCPALLLDYNGNILYKNASFTKEIEDKHFIFNQNLLAYCKQQTPIQLHSDDKMTFKNLIETPFTSEINHINIQWITTEKKLQDGNQVLLTLATILEEKSLINSLIDNVPAQIFWKNEHLIYQGCNQDFVKSLKLTSKEEVIGKSDFDLPVSKSDSEKFRADDKQIMLSKKPKLNIEEHQVLANGEVKHLLTSKVPLFNHQDEVIGILAVYIDITKQKKLQDDLSAAKDKAEEASIAKSKFIQNMSHDIRTPLTGIVGLSGILVHDALNDANRENARMLKLSGEQLLSLLNSVLDIVSSDSLNQESIELSSFSIHELLHNIFELELPALKLKNLDLQLKLDDKIPSFIEADKGKIYRILLNLMSNSIKFTAEGKITIAKHA